MKKSSYKFLFILPCLALTSCGYGLKEVYSRTDYNNVSFDLNYYNVWDEEIDALSENNKITKVANTLVLDSENIHCFTSWDDERFSVLEPNKGDKQNYVSDRTETSYGPTHNLSSIEPTFKYGYLSKLFDGQMFCNGGFELVRVQAASNNDAKRRGGFGTLFEKRCESSNYFAISFKSIVDNRRGALKDLGSHKATFNLQIGFYFADGNGYEKRTVSCVLEDKYVNGSDGTFMNRENYTFFGFELDDYFNIEGCCGMSLEYDLISDQYIDSYLGDDKPGFSLMVYEMLLPDSTWL